MFQKKLQTIPRQNFGVAFLKMLAHFILLKYRLILCLLRSFKWKQKNYETRQGMQRRCNHLLYNVQFSPFYPCHINLNILKRKKIISAHLQFCILCDLKTLISVCILKMKRVQTGHRIEMQLYSCHFPLFLSFSKMWLMVLFFTNQKTLRFMCSIVHVLHLQCVYRKFGSDKISSSELCILCAFIITEIIIM